MTPADAGLVQQWQGLCRTPGIVSRGYGADTSGENDEKRGLRQLCPDVLHEQNPNRILASQRLIDQGVDVIVLDDAFQHRRIHRDLNILLIDATCPFGYGYQLPRGLLRESLRGLTRADLVLITRADRVSDDTRRTIRENVREIARDMTATDDRGQPPCYELSFQPTQLQTAAGARLAVDNWPDRAATVMTATGNPAAVLPPCAALGFDVQAERLFPDHHLYTAADVARVLSAADKAQTQTVLTTLKDLVKLPSTEERFVAVLIETVFATPQEREAVRHALEGALAAVPQRV